jgi:hypothetical protein
MKDAERRADPAPVESGTVVRLSMPHPVSGGIELAAGSIGRVTQSYDSELGRRYVLQFDDIETVVFAHEIHPASDSADSPGGRTADSSASGRAVRPGADTRPQRRHSGEK